ncbi:MAG: branched-chain amino acid ABC transporter permease, partial [Deltaproteobacteria bacterium]|nr:branched-chain amino acid ABC transporter permease [Deltaproteobacteria bacterium]
MPTRKLVTRQEDHLKRFPDMWHKVGLVLGTAFVLTWPFLANSRWLTYSNHALTAVVGAMALMILTGFAGQISLGHAAFLALGAYTVAVLGFHLHVPFWLAIPVAGVVAAAVGLAVGPFALRLRGLYLAIVTLGLLFLVDHFLLGFPDITGGVGGISVPMHTWFSAPEGTSALGDFARASQFGPVALSFPQKLYFVFLFIAVVVTFVGSNVRRSRTGRAMMAVRDSDLAAAALGVNPAGAKVLSFGLSSFLAGIAGAMFGFQMQYITVEPPFDLVMSVEYIAMIVLGGIGTV